MNINYLRIPIAYLFDIDSLHNFTEFKESSLEYFANGYEEIELKEIIEALRWAKEHPEHDFSSMLPDIKYNNNEVYDYLCIFERDLSSYLINRKQGRKQ